MYLFHSVLAGAQLKAQDQSICPLYFVQDIFISNIPDNGNVYNAVECCWLAILVELLHIG